MATITDLSRTFDGWLRWLRLRRAVSWAVRGLLFGLAVSLGIGLFGLLQARLLRNEFLALVGFSALIFSSGAALAAYFWPVQRIKAARTFDRAFGLQERVSTAMELSGTERTDKETFGVSGELVRRQLQDAIEAARMVKPQLSLPMRFQLREGLFALILVILLSLTWFQGGNLFVAAQQARSVQQAAAAQAEKIKTLLANTQSNPDLTPAQKQALSAPLQQALNQLNDNSSQEGSVSTLTSAGEKLQALSSPQAAQMTQALQAAGSQAAGQSGSPLQSVGQKLAQGNSLSAAAQLGQIDPSKLSLAQASQLASQLQDMAKGLSATNPQLASQLNAAADALKSGNTAAAQQALQPAAQSMAQAGQQAAFSQAAGQAAQQMQQGAGQMLAAGGGQQPGNSVASAGQAAGQGPGQGQGAGQNPQSGATGGAGSGHGQGTGGNGHAAGSTPIQQGNGPGNGGETTYEKIYAPSLLGGNGGQTLNLPSSGQDGTAIGQGPTTPSDPGQSQVPYQQVYSQYDQANNQAIENGSVPLEFMQVIKSYFDSLKP
jgi:hypothetical protein